MAEAALGRKDLGQVISVQGSISEITVPACAVVMSLLRNNLFTTNYYLYGLVDELLGCCWTIPNRAELSADDYMRVYRLDEPIFHIICMEIPTILHHLKTMHMNQRLNDNLIYTVENLCERYPTLLPELRTARDSCPADWHPLFDERINELYRLYREYPTEREDDPARFLEWIFPDDPISTDDWPTRARKAGIDI